MLDLPDELLLVILSWLADHQTARLTCSRLLRLTDSVRSALTWSQGCHPNLQRFPHLQQLLVTGKDVSVETLAAQVPGCADLKDVRFTKHKLKDVCPLTRTFGGHIHAKSFAIRNKRICRLHLARAPQADLFHSPILRWLTCLTLASNNIADLRLDLPLLRSLNLAHIRTCLTQRNPQLLLASTQHLVQLTLLEVDLQQSLMTMTSLIHLEYGHSDQEYRDLVSPLAQHPSLQSICIVQSICGNRSFVTLWMQCRCGGPCRNPWGMGDAWLAGTHGTRSVDMSVKLYRA